MSSSSDGSAGHFGGKRLFGSSCWLAGCDVFFIIIPNSEHWWPPFSPSHTPHILSHSHLPHFPNENCCWPTIRVYMMVMYICSPLFAPLNGWGKKVLFIMSYSIAMHTLTVFLVNRDQLFATGVEWLRGCTNRSYIHAFASPHRTVSVVAKNHSGNVHNILNYIVHVIAKWRQPGMCHVLCICFSSVYFCLAFQPFKSFCIWQKNWNYDASVCVCVSVWEIINCCWP